MPRRPIDHAQIRESIRKYVGDGQKVRRVMACGHEDEVFLSVDTSTTECWVCRMGRKTTGPPAEPEK